MTTSSVALMVAGVALILVLVVTVISGPATPVRVRIALASMVAGLALIAGGVVVGVISAAGDTTPRSCSAAVKP